MKRTRRVDVVSDDDDAQLMLAYARGEMRAFETLYARHRGALYRYLVRQARDTETANDLFQEVWSRVIVNRARYEPRAKFRTFLFTLAHNCFIDHCRRIKARPTGMGVDDADAADLLPADEAVVAGIGDRARRKLAALSRGARDPAAGTARRLSTSRGVGSVARGDRARHGSRRRDRQEPAALRGRQAQGGHDRRGRRDMTGPDDEFDDFLARRKPVFRRSTEDPFEPPEELDRIVLRQAREAIERERPDRVYHGPRWGMPVALAATLLLVFTVVLQLGRTGNAPEPEVDGAIHQPADRTRWPQTGWRGLGSQRCGHPHGRAAGADPPALATASRPKRKAIAIPPRSAATAGRLGPSCRPRNRGRAVVMSAPPPSEAERAVAAAGSTPAWRRDATTWLAEIERLRAEGKVAEADAELAEFKRQHRAYAVSPDR